MPTIDTLLPKVARFNDYIRAHPEDFSDFEMWHFEKNGNREIRSENHLPGAIPPQLAKLGVFVFVGKLHPLDKIDFEEILRDLDQLLSLYLFVEGGGEMIDELESNDDWILFRPGCPDRVRWTDATVAEKKLDIIIRHAAIQKALHDELATEFGPDHVGTELLCRAGGRIDAMVKDEAIQIVFEIKTASTARGCVREAIGQLLDYACWPSSPQINGLVVVGTPSLTADTSAYLARLNERFPIPLSYRQVVLLE